MLVILQILTPYNTYFFKIIAQFVLNVNRTHWAILYYFVNPIYRKGVHTMFPRIRYLREDADLTRTQISKQLNISQRAYSHYENGTRDIPINILISIADFYQVSVDYLLERTDRKELL